ncbi:MAG: hypothetical protein R2849_04525 [Thermomicrobiales bacterium]
MATKIGRRVIVIGNSGSGSTLGAQLAERTGRAPHRARRPPLGAELDNGRGRSSARGSGRRCSRNPGVMAGNYTRKQQDVSWPEADTIIWPDPLLATSMSRTIRCCWQRHQDQEDLWGTGNRVRTSGITSEALADRRVADHMLKTHRACRRLFESYTRDPQWSHITFIRLRSPEAVDRFFDRLRPLPIPRQATAPLS